MKLKNILLGSMLSLSVATGMATQVAAHPIHDAARDNNPEAIAHELANGTDIDLVDADGTTALVWASFKGHTSAVNLLLRKGANVNIPNHRGMTALIHAARERHPEIVNTLLAHNANVNHRTVYGVTALMGASAWFGDLEMVKTLLAHGANPDMADINRKTAFDMAKNDAIKAFLQEYTAARN